MSDPIAQRMMGSVLFAVLMSVSATIARFHSPHESLSMHAPAIGRWRNRCIHRGNRVASCNQTGPWHTLALCAHACLFFPRSPRYTPALMSIRKGGGEWEPMLLGVEARLCRVCQDNLYRDKTMLRGGWSRCTLCDEFVHYSCLASGKVSFLKARPRVCKTCRSVQEGTVAPSLKKDGPPVAVPS